MSLQAFQTKVCCVQSIQVWQQWTGAPAMQHSLTSRLANSLTPIACVVCQAAAKGHKPAATEGNKPAAAKGNKSAAALGNKSVPAKGNKPIAARGNKPAAVPCGPLQPLELAFAASNPVLVLWRAHTYMACWSWDHPTYAIFVT